MSRAPPLAAFLLALVGAAGAAPGRGAVLEIENAARGTRWRVALAPGERFSVTSQSSLYDAPVTETFAVRDDGRIALRTVSSPSAAVREYLGITGAGEVHAVERIVPELVFRVAMGAPQRLRAGGAERSFLELGDHGDRLVVRATVPGEPPLPASPPASRRERSRRGACGAPSNT